MKTIIYQSMCVSVLLLNILSCTNKNERAYQITDFPKSKELIWKVHKIPNAIFRIETMFVTNDNLVVCKRNDETLFDIFSLTPLTFKFSGGTRGQGPTDFGKLHFRNFTPRKHGFSVLESGSCLLKQVNITEQIKISSSEKLFKDKSTVNGFYTLSNDKYLTFGEIDGVKEYNIIDKKDNSTTGVGEYPDWTLSKEPYSRFVSGIKSCVVHPDKTRFATFYGRMKHARIYNDKGDLLHDISIQTTPFLKKMTSIMPNDLAEFYTYPQATEKYIYVLCANKLPNDDGLELKQELEVWDWQGKPVARYRLNNKVSCIAISEKHKKIYGIDSETEHVLYSYDLPLY